jgi:diketogulonate reductase-like aldo/keto reductase
LPYDPRAPIRDQVQQSTASSIEHLKISRLDSLVLHGPSFGRGLVPDDWEAWRAMEDAHDRAQTRFLGISNVAIDQLESLVREARVKPAFVQNRCYAAQGWDRGIREFCKQHGVLYQGFSLLTANRDALGHSTVIRIAAARGWSPAQVVFRFALDIGMIALTGTTSAEHMSADLAVLDAPSLDQAEIDQIDRIDTRR